MRIILGSDSPRRKEILNSILNDVDTASPEIDEKIHHDELPVDYSKRISMEKSESIIRKILPAKEPLLIITSDTIVTIDNKILGKPGSLDEAVEMLELLNGKTHTVISSITFQHNDFMKTFKSLTECEGTSVRFKYLSDSDIIAYLDRIDFMDKAGSYAIQEYGEMIIDWVKGSISNVIGFPLRLFYSMITRSGLTEILF